MSRTFKITVPKITVPEVTLPEFEVPWPNGAAIAKSLKSRIPVQKSKSTSKLPMLLGAVIVIVALVILAMGIRKMCAGASGKEYTMDAEPDPTPVVTDTEEN